MEDERVYRFNRDDGRKTTIILAALLILVVVVGGALLYVLSQKGAPPPAPPAQNETPKPPPVQNETNMTNVTPPCDDQCLFGGAVSAGNVSACGSISASELRQQCYSELSNVSLEACRQVSNETRKQECVTSFAKAEDDITLCDLLSSGVEECRLAVDPCLGSEDQKLCRALSANDASECGQNTACLLNFSLTKKDEASCSLIQNSVVKTACVSSVRNSDRCYTLPQTAEKDYCYQLYATYSGDYLTCTSITPNTAYALDCFSHFAGTLGDLSICDRKEFDLNNVWSCYTNFSLISGDIAGCENIHELATTAKFNCAFEFAKLHGDPAACQLIESQSSRSTCYQGAIIYSNQNLDWRNCADITNFEWRNKCYNEGAKVAGDITVCDNIQETFAREACKSAYEIAQGG
ncbi:MAG: hypothetical protein AB1324_07230 [Candidatus Micrarchaeota archaeon]